MKSYLQYLPGHSLDPLEYGIYPESLHYTSDGSYVYMMQRDGETYLVAPENVGFSGKTFTNSENVPCTLAPLTHENAVLLRKLFPFTAPVPVLSQKRSFGVGDRLGLATPGHLRVFSRFDAFPVLAQQSIRELTLTKRTFHDVLDSVSFAVFRENFQRGFGADGDHLKTADEVQYALSCGYTMITLDCSEYIHNEIADMTPEELKLAYTGSEELKEKYIGKTFSISEGVTLYCDEDEFYRAFFVYYDAILFIEKIYYQFIQNHSIDFEISIDETETPTTPLQHFFIANELKSRGVCFATIAPRFCGEFQKGVDYMGDLDQFCAEAEQHAAIAEAMGYKLSVHSGSDKFSVFPAIGRLTKGHFHVKTAGTNWLEAMKLVAIMDPSLYREIHTFALEAFPDARKYYHVTTDITNIPPLDTLTDAQLPELFDNHDARQLIHITYGAILTAQSNQGTPLFHDRLYALWSEYSEDYAQLLDRHIGKHLTLLYSQIPENSNLLS